MVERCKDVRSATGLKQADFAARLDQAAKRLHGEKAIRYDQPLVSILENGGRSMTLEDVAVYAAVDPLRRGKLWMGWGEHIESAARPETDAELELRTGVKFKTERRPTSELLEEGKTKPAAKKAAGEGRGGRRPR
jgi:transcriptional regulator with XRE-family HTH domain